MNMLIYENYVVEKVDNLNFKVYKLGQNSAGTEVQKDVTYHANLPQSLIKLRRLLHNDKFFNSVATIESAIKKIEEIDKDFTSFLDSFTVKKLQKAFEVEVKAV
jgi:type III secretory pathway component EscR